MSGQSVITANKRYFRGFMITIIIYAVIVFAGPLAIGFIDNPPKWMFALLAVLSAAPAAYIFVLIGRFLKETDEYTRQRLASAMVIAGGVTFSFCFLWGFLELYEVAPHFWTFLTPPLFFASLLLTQLYRRITGS